MALNPWPFMLCLHMQGWGPMPPTWFTWYSTINVIVISVKGIIGVPSIVNVMYTMLCMHLQGWGPMATYVVLLQVFGGLIVGMVVKYADNILKNFANALSVILTVVGAIPLFHQYPSVFFLFGVAMVLLSVFMYGKSTPSGLNISSFQSCYRTVSTKHLTLLLQQGQGNGRCLTRCMLPHYVHAAAA